MQNGYDPDFIGDEINIELPSFRSPLKKNVLRKSGILRDDIYSDHIHFSLVMNMYTRQLIYSAYNIDQTKFRPKVSGKGKRTWKIDKNIGPENQLDNTYYKDRKNPAGEEMPNPYDRGHMVMRFNNMWGSTDTESDRAGKATFIYANSSLQHKNLNRDEWQAIELKIVRKFQHAENGRLSVFTGPIFGALDRFINLSDSDSARIPSGFFKIICYQKKHGKPGDELGVLAFAVFQDEVALRDRSGNRTIKENACYQVTISEIQDWTGIRFDKQLYQKNPLFYHDLKDRNSEHSVSFAPERIPVRGTDNIVSDSSHQRKKIEHLSIRKVIINSAMINPKGPQKSGEWISLHNRGNKKIKIDGWRLVDGQGRTGTLTGSIGSGESIKIKGKNKGKVMLSNSGGSMMLYDKENCLIDYVTWSKQQVRRTEKDVAFIFDNAS